MGLKPFSKVSFEEIPCVFWGNGLCEMIEDVQTACNAIARAIINNVVKNIDSKVIATSVERQYYFNLDHDKGIDDVPDLRIIAKGTSSLIAKEQQAIRRSEFLQTTNNPVDAEIMGTEGRRQLLREAARALELDVNNIVPEPSAQSPSNAPANAETQPVQAKNPAGDAASGGDFKLFQKVQRIEDKPKITS
ncbi:MAG: hypothetical protein L7F77_09430 [Candidatus Magnetominusculus sp. LBB02]|nr:hypothetical protein [Candidatus Magnetominusculus sp. LBB02]